MFILRRHHPASPDSAPPALLVDFDGVIADSFQAYFSEYTAVCTEMGLSRLNSREAFLALFDGNLIECLIRSGFSLRRLRELANMLGPRIEAASVRVDSFPGMPEVLNRLADRHPVHVITSNHTDIAKAFLQRHGVSGMRSITGADVEASKVRKIRRAMRQERGYKPYYVGDTRGDMIETRRAGAIPVGVSWGWHDAKRLASGRSWKLVHSPTELERLFTNHAGS